MSEQWYYSKDRGERMGPVSEEDLCGMLSRGELHSTDMVWKEGMADWAPIHKCPEFNPSVPPRDAVLLPNGLLGWMNFIGICTIVMGAVNALSCVGILWGVLMIIAGIALLGARTALLDIERVDATLAPFFTKLNTYVMVTGICYIIMLVGMAIMLVVYFAVIAAALSGALGGMN